MHIHPWPPINQEAAKRITFFKKRNEEKGREKERTRKKKDVFSSSHLSSSEISMCFCTSVCPLGKVRALSGGPARVTQSPAPQPSPWHTGDPKRTTARCPPLWTQLHRDRDGDVRGLRRGRPAVLTLLCPMSRLQGCWGRAQPERTPHHSGTSSRREACWLVSLVHSFSRVSVPSSDKYPSGPTITTGGAGRPSRDSDCTHRRTSWRW